MQAIKIEATIEKDGSLTLQSLPFAAGQRVEVIVLPASAVNKLPSAYPLRGTTYRYDQPTEPVAAEDWEAAR